MALVHTLHYSETNHFGEKHENYRDMQQILHNSVTKYDIMATLDTTCIEDSVQLCERTYIAT